MTGTPRCRPTQPAETRAHLVRPPQRGAATAEFAIGVVAAVLVAALLLHLVLSGFFEVLLQSLYERGLDLAIDFLATTLSWSLSDISTGVRSGLSAVSRSAVGWTWDAVVNTSSAVSSGALSVSQATASAVSTVAESVFDATARALRWAGGPVSSALPW